MHRLRIRCAACLLMLAAALLAGCVGVPSHPPSPPSQALTDVTETRLARIAAANRPADAAPAASGFRILPQGDIYELNPTVTRRSGLLGNFGRSLGRLHAKVAVIDRRRVFVGSMNLDPRSAHANTEVGLVIDSPDIAAGMHRLFEGNLAASAYHLRLTADREHIEWVEQDAPGHEIVHADEPDSNWLLRVKLRLLSAVVREDLL